MLAFHGFGQSPNIISPIISTLNKSTIKGQVTCLQGDIDLGDGKYCHYNYQNCQPIDLLADDWYDKSPQPIWKTPEELKKIYDQYQPTVVVGFSEGGLLAAQLAAQYPAIKGLVIMSSPYPNNVPGFKIHTDHVVITFSPNDEVVPSCDTMRWAQHCSKIPSIVEHCKGHRLFTGAAVKKVLRQCV